MPTPPHSIRRQAAILFSWLGHPGVLLPITVAGSGWIRGTRGSIIVGAMVAVVALIGISAAYGWWQVRKRRWADLDASHPDERRQLNRFMLPLLIVASFAVWYLGPSRALALGLGLAAGIVFVAQLLSRHLKLSMHCAFATYASALHWPVLPAVLPLAALVIAVAWSRLELRRHVMVDVVVGILAGALTGLAFQLLHSRPVVAAHG